jgi:hypothetical protein
MKGTLDFEKAFATTISLAKAQLECEAQLNLSAEPSAHAKQRGNQNDVSLTQLVLEATINSLSD